MQKIKNIIEIENLSFKYSKDFILKDINLNIMKNDFLTILGPNGAGKSTLFKLILGINSLQDGHIIINGQAHLKNLESVGYVPQNTNINPSFPINVLEVVMMGQNKLKKRLFGYKKDEKEKAIQSLEKVNMDQFAHNKMSSLSGGQKQRVLIARALFANPKIILLDEPTSNIDIDGSKQVYETLKELTKDLTIVVISHDISVVLKYATKAVYINKLMTYHDLTKMKDSFKSLDAHICEIELLEMLGKCKC